jgi:hypothetical protein
LRFLKERGRRRIYGTEEAGKEGMVPSMLLICSP